MEYYALINNKEAVEIELQPSCLPTTTHRCSSPIFILHSTVGIPCERSNCQSITVLLFFFFFFSVICNFSSCLAHRILLNGIQINRQRQYLRMFTIFSTTNSGCMTSLRETSDWRWPHGEQSSLIYFYKYHFQMVDAVTENCHMCECGFTVYE